MQESLRGRPENVVERRRGSDLGHLYIVRFDAVDGGCAIDVILTEPGTRGEDFAVSQVCEFGGRISFCCAVTVAGENIEAKDSFGALGEREEEGEGEKGV